jgi:hypothetical protein
VAIALGDKLDRESADTLLGPWRSLPGRFRTGRVAAGPLPRRRRRTQ